MCICQYSGIDLQWCALVFVNIWSIMLRHVCMDRKPAAAARQVGHSCQNKHDWTHQYPSEGLFLLSFLRTLVEIKPQKRLFLQWVSTCFIELIITWIYIYLFYFIFCPLPAFCCRLLFRKSIFLEELWSPVKVEMLAIKNLAYIQKCLCKAWAVAPHELTDSFIISRNRHINCLQYRYYPPALTKLFSILNVPPEHPLLNKMNNTGAKGCPASAEKAQLFMSTSLIKTPTDCQAL